MALEYSCLSCNQTFRETTAEAVIRRGMVEAWAWAGYAVTRGLTIGWFAPPPGAWPTM